MAFNQEDELVRSKFSVVVKQMSSDNPQIRALALESLNRMVESEVAHGTNSNENKSEKNPRDVMQRIRLVQHERSAQQHRRKKWFSMI